MSASAAVRVSPFAADIWRGLSGSGQKKISPRFFYDDLGSALFEAITLLPEYGLSRADERLLSTHARDIACEIGPVSTVVELGSGSGKKTRHVLNALVCANPELVYRPVDVSEAALNLCANELGDVCEVKPVCADWVHGLEQSAWGRWGSGAMLVLFLGSSIGNLDREQIEPFLCILRGCMRAADFFLLGADLVKDEETMLAAYDDATGVTAAFNLNILGRINRELQADFDLRAFVHEARWNQAERRIEMHLLSCCDQVVHVRALELRVQFHAGETIWTESSHKFDEPELAAYARSSGFHTVRSWRDCAWPFVETLWQGAA